VRCIFANICFSGKRPVNPAYPTKLITLGDHLRKVRLDRGLYQLQVAKLFKVTEDSVIGWELNRHQPTARLAKRIIQFLGYCHLKNETLGQELYFARLVSGMTQEQVAKLIGCDESNLRQIELNKRNPRKKVLDKIQNFISAFKINKISNKSI